MAQGKELIARAIHDRRGADRVKELGSEQPPLAGFEAIPEVASALGKGAWRIQ